MRLGNDQASGEIYETTSNIWRIVLPRPIITGALLDPPFPISFPAADRAGWHMFREEHFDPTTRIRRGRFYAPSPGERPAPQRVLPRTAGDSIEGVFNKPLFVYDGLWLTPDEKPPSLVALGAAGRVSLWRVVALPELISTGELLFTLKARHAFAILPEIDHEAVPELGRRKVAEAVQSLADAAHREAPSSIIDLACEAIQWCLATWAAAKFPDVDFFDKELEKITDYIETHYKDENGKKIQMTALKVAEIVQRLHPRRKPHEQQRRRLRPPVEDDAELAVKAAAFVIRELRWAAV